jgi:GNAT superfamily N-acetyltransferase
MDSRVTTLPLKQLVYRGEFRSQLPLRELRLGTFRYWSTPLHALPLWRGLLRRFGPLKAAKTLLKLLTPSRDLVCVSDAGEIVAHSFITLSFCRYYPVERGAVVVGNVWTDPGHRGKGLAEAMLGRAINHLVTRGHHVFYIDTREDNAPMRTVIERFGFGAPVRAIEPYE